MISDNRGSTMLTENYTDCLGSKEAQSPKPENILCPSTGRAGDGRMLHQRFLRKVWFYCEVNHASTEAKKMFSRNGNLTFSFFPKALEEPKNPLCWPLSWSQPSDTGGPSPCSRDSGSGDTM